MGDSAFRMSRHAMRFCGNKTLPAGPGREKWAAGVMLLFMLLSASACAPATRIWERLSGPTFKPVETRYAITFSVPDDWEPVKSLSAGAAMEIPVAEYEGPVKGESSLRVSISNSTHLDNFRIIAESSQQDFAKIRREMMKLYHDMMKRAVPSSAGDVQVIDLLQVTTEGYPGVLIVFHFRHKPSRKNYIGALKIIFMDKYAVQALVTAPFDTTSYKDSTSWRTAGTVRAVQLSYDQLKLSSGKNLEREALETRWVEIPGKAGFELPATWAQTEVENPTVIGFRPPSALGFLTFQTPPALFSGMFKEMFQQDEEARKRTFGLFSTILGLGMSKVMECKVIPGTVEKIEGYDFDLLQMGFVLYHTEKNFLMTQQVLVFKQGERMFQISFIYSRDLEEAADLMESLLGSFEFLPEPDKK